MFYLFFIEIDTSAEVLYLVWFLLLILFLIPIKWVKTANEMLNSFLQKFLCQATYFSFDVDSAAEIQTRKSALVVVPGRPR